MSEEKKIFAVMCMFKKIVRNSTYSATKASSVMDVFVASNEDEARGMAIAEFEDPDERGAMTGILVKEVGDHMIREALGGGFCSSVRGVLQDAKRYAALKQKIEYFDDEDGMTVAKMKWDVDVCSMSPCTLDEAIDQILLGE